VTGETPVGAMGGETIGDRAELGGRGGATGFRGGWNERGRGDGGWAVSAGGSTAATGRWPVLSRRTKQRRQERGCRGGRASEQRKRERVEVWGFWV